MRLIDADELSYKMVSMCLTSQYCQGFNDAVKMAKDAPIVTEFEQWVSVKDRLPEDDREVLAVSDGCVLIANWQGEWIKYIELEDDYTRLEPVNINVQYWMELPKPPKED